MVLKKRSMVSSEEEEPKKRRKEAKGEDVSSKKSKKNKAKEYVVKVKEDRLSDDDEEEEEVDEEEIPFDHKEDGDGEPPQWPQADLIELFSRIESLIPVHDTLVYSTRAERLDWDEIAFKSYSPLECKTVWCGVAKKIRRFRVLKEMIADARQWANKPWTNFYSGNKQNHHPDMPRRPLTQYMVYYLEKKEKVAKSHPELDMVNLSKLIAKMYKALPPGKKEKYIAKAQALREEYQEKLRIFNEKHPEFEELKARSKGSRSHSQLPEGLKKPRTPQVMFIEDRLEKLKNDPKFDKHVITENAKAQWKNLSDKKKLVWINWALEEESKYLDRLKLYMAEHPHFEPPPHKTVLKKDELILKDRASGKPAKPPNSAYSMYSRIMLAKCPDLRELIPKERMKEISVRWNQMPESERAEYVKKVKYEQDRYKLEYATYLESLPEEERQEELLKTQTKRKKAEKESKEVNNGRKARKSKKSGKKNNSVQKYERQYFPGEPVQPPVNAFDLFVESFVSDTKLSEDDAPRYWDMLPQGDKLKFQKKLKELKEKYIKDYKKFLKSLDEEQVAKYNDLQKRNKEREAAAEAHKSQLSDDSDEASSSDEEDETASNNIAAKREDSDSDDENEGKAKSDSSSDSSSSSSAGSSSSSSSSDDSDSSSDDSDDEDKKTSKTNVKKEISDSDSSDED